MTAPKLRGLLLAFCGLAAAVLPVPAQEDASAPGPASAGTLTNERIIAMVKSGVGESVILSLIERSPDKLDGGPAALVQLRSAGAGNNVLMAVRRATMLHRKGASSLASDPGQAVTEEPAAREDPVALPAAGRMPGGKTPDLFYDGKLSLGVGYPYLSGRYEFSGFAVEPRFYTGAGVQAYALRGYWNFYKRDKIKAHTGLEGGYVKFKTLGLNGSGTEFACFMAGEYEIDEKFSIMLDFAPTLITLRDRLNSDVSVSDISWVVNLGVYFRIPTSAPKTVPHAGTSNTPAPREEETDSEMPARPKPAVKQDPYADYLAAADNAVADNEYNSADEEYAKALYLTSDDDKRRVFLFERRGWLALKQKSYSRAKDFYLAAVTAAKRLDLYDKDTVNAYCGLAYCFEKTDNIPLAIKNYKRALDLTANSVVKSEIEKTLRRLNDLLPQDAAD